MLVDLDQEIVEEFIGFCKTRALRCNDYSEIDKYVSIVRKLTRPKGKIIKKMLSPSDEVVLKFHYPPSKKIKYHITSVKDGIFYGVRSKKLKLKQHEILNLKSILESNIKLETLNDWKQLADSFGVTVGAIQTYAYNCEIGTFEEYLPTANGQTTLEYLRMNQSNCKIISSGK